MQSRDIVVTAIDDTSLGNAVGQISRLIHATGPVSYDYQFGADGIALDLFVGQSWVTPETLFAASTTRQALVRGKFAGIEIGFAGADFYRFKTNLLGVATSLVEAGAMPLEDLMGVAERAGKASYLNAHVSDDVYYILALSVEEAFRGCRVGAALFDDAVHRARQAGFRALELDVLADNPAVDFYYAKGMNIIAETRSPELSRDYGFPAELRMGVML